MSHPSPNLLDPFFNYDLAVQLSLEADGQQVQLVSGNIEKISLDLRSYGFSANIQCSGINNDNLNNLYNSTKVIKATLTVIPTDPSQSSGSPLLELKGIVVDKHFRRVDHINDDKNQAVRLYEFTILDNARATWGEHYPLGIYVDASMKDVIEAHKNSEITINYNFSILEQTLPIIAFSLAYNNSRPENEQVSFYSFLTWYLHQEGGILAYDYEKNSYSILAQKEPPSGDPYQILDWWIAPPTSKSPRTSRYNSRVIQHTSDTFDPEDQPNQNAFTSVRRDSITPNNYQAFPEQAQEKVAPCLVPQFDQLEVEALQFQKDFHLDKLIPGSYVSFATHSVESWSQDACYNGKVFRSRLLFFEADKLDVSEIMEKPVQNYRLYVKAILEPKEEIYIERPYYYPPLYPFSIQGKIFSDIGDTEQTTYKISEGEQAPQGQYLVAVPLAGEEKKLVVPFTPDLMSGQYYFPFCKGEKVLLSVYFHTAKIQRIIDWQPLARLPSGVQGNQIVLSSNGQDKYAFIKHEFEGGTNSVITIQQATSPNQIQTIQIQDQSLVISVDQLNTRIITIQLNSNCGLLLSLQDQSSEITQEVALDGQNIILTCSNASDTSQFAQSPDSITLTCKQFNVSSETINLAASDTITQSGQSKVNITTQIADVQASTVKLGG
jgi:hypothetical protein